jgi:RNA polymerase sigma-70 factor (ECF subfamily)
VDDFEGWLRTRYPVAYRTACLLLGNPADAEEAVQEAFLRVWRFRDSMPDGPARQAWLYRVVVNTCRSRQRADAARPRIAAQLDEELPDGNDDGGDGPAEQIVRAADVQQALAALPEHLRIAVVLYYYVGLVDREIAQVIHRRPGTVRARLAEARSRLAADPQLAAWAPADVEGTA